MNLISCGESALLPIERVLRQKSSSSVFSSHYLGLITLLLTGMELYNLCNNCGYSIFITPLYSSINLEQTKGKSWTQHRSYRIYYVNNAGNIRYCFLAKKQINIFISRNIAMQTRRPQLCKSPLQLIFTYMAHDHKKPPPIGPKYGWKSLPKTPIIVQTPTPDTPYRTILAPAKDVSVFQTLF